MRKWTAGLLVMVLLVTLVAGSAVADSSKVQLVGMCWGSTAQYEDLTAKIMAANPDLAAKYDVTWVLGGEGDAAVAEKIRLGLSAGENVSDFAVLNYTQVPEFAREGVLTDISGAVEPYLDTMTSAAKSLSQYNGQTIAVPFEVKTKVWYYRSDIFEECGIDVNAIKNTDDLIAAGKKIQETHPKSYIWNLGRTTPGYSFYLTLAGNNAKFFDEEGNYTIASDPGTKAMLEDYKKLVDSGVISEISDWSTDWYGALADGTIVSQLSAGWLGQNIFLPTYSGEGNKWKVTLWPTIGGADSGSDAGGSVMVVPAYSKHPSEAAEFIAAACLSETGSMAVFGITGSLPQNTNVLTNPDTFADQVNGYFGDTYVKAQEQALDKFSIFNYSPNASSEQTIAVEYFIKAIYGDLSIDDALTAAQNDMQMLIGKAFE